MKRFVLIAFDLIFSAFIWYVNASWGNDFSGCGAWSDRWWIKAVRRRTKAKRFAGVLFNSVKVHYAPDDYLLQAESKGTMKFTPDTLLFQTGRMTHMSVSCVGCGACEDCCPMDIKVAQIFSIAADETQKLFDYIPGKRDAPPPLRVYNEQELKEYET